MQGESGRKKAGSFSRSMGAGAEKLQKGQRSPGKSLRHKPCESEFRNRHTEDSQSNPRSH